MQAAGGVGSSTRRCPIRTMGAEGESQEWVAAASTVALFSLSIFQNRKMAEAVNAAELRENLKEYEEQLEQVLFYFREN